MEIILGKNAGFCFGVNKAVKSLFELLDKTSQQIYTLGPIIHNEQVVRCLEERGIKVIRDISEAKPGGHVVIRTHGVTPDVYCLLENKGLDYTDATCPYVKKIHNLVKEKYDNGYKIIIIGDREHPEVKGINGWCGNSALIFDSVEEIYRMPDINVNDKYCVVAQTTLTREKWDAITAYLETRFKNIEKFNTICNATSARQNEAVELACKVDMMLVIGGKDSSNTHKLYDICKRYCSNTFKIETSDDIPPVDIKKIKRIGVTAGASTPEWIIKEVILKMEELYTQENELSFKDAFESTLVSIHTGQLIKGRVVSFNNNEVFLDIGYKCDGVIPADEFTDDPDVKISQSVKIGDEVEAIVLKVNDGEGSVLLSKKKADAIKGWDRIEEAFEKKDPVKAKVVESVNGGVMAIAEGVKVFIPASQIGERFEKDLSKFIGQEIKIRIIEFNKKKKRVVGSQRVILTEEKQAIMDNFWNNIEVGKKYIGMVKSLTDFGAFVDIGGVDGLVHLTELSWTKIKHPSEVLKVGDKVEVTILNFDREKKRISLAYKKPEDNPWNDIDQKYKVGDVVKGTVVRMVPFGVFVELEKGIDGLVHISQISNKRIAKPGDVLEVGETVEAKVMEVNPETKKISLSIKEVRPIDEKIADKKNEKTDQAQTEGVEVPTEHKEEMSNTIGEILNNNGVAK